MTCIDMLATALWIYIFDTSPTQDKVFKTVQIGPNISGRNRGNEVCGLSAKLLII